MRKIKADYIPRHLKTMVRKGDAYGLNDERRKLWNRCKKLAGGNRAMSNMGLNGNTNIVTLLKIEEKLFSNAAMRHAIRLSNY